MTEVEIARREWEQAYSALIQRSSMANVRNEQKAWDRLRQAILAAMPVSDEGIKAGEVQRGQWMLTPTGAYLVNGVTVKDGLAYIGTTVGVAVFPADQDVFVTAAAP